MFHFVFFCLVIEIFGGYFGLIRVIIPFIKHNFAVNVDVIVSAVFDYPSEAGIVEGVAIVELMISPSLLM
jgi:hypothetical protein